VLIESRLQLHGAAMSVSDHILDALLDHLRDQDLPMILARLADRSEPCFKTPDMAINVRGQGTA